MQLEFLGGLLQSALVTGLAATIAACGLLPGEVVPGGVDAGRDAAAADATTGTHDAGPGDAADDVAAEDVDAGPCPGGCDGEACFEGVCGGSAIVQISAGTGVGCVLTRAGSVWCWGLDSYGQLGTMTEHNKCFSLIGSQFEECSWVPAKVPGLHDVIQVSSGDESACAIESDNSVWCWGWNNYGVLGHWPNTAPDDQGCPVDVGCNPMPSVVRYEDGGLVAAKAIAMWGDPCVVTTSGNVACWGDNTTGQLANGTIGGWTASPAVIPGLSGIAKVASHGLTVCALKIDGSVLCWGWENQGFGHTPDLHGPYGDVACTSVLSNQTGYCEPHPTLVYQADNVTPQFGSDGAGMLVATDIAVGEDTACAIAGGDVWCWGGYGQWQAGPAPHTFPAKLITGAGATGISMSLSHAMAATAEGGALSWGQDDFGATGVGYLEFDGGGPNGVLQLPAPVKIEPEVVQVAAGWAFGLLLTSDGTVWAAGLNDTGRLGHEPGSDGDHLCTGLGQTAPCNPTPTPVQNLP